MQRMRPARYRPTYRERFRRRRGPDGFTSTQGIPSRTMHLQTIFYGALALLAALAFAVYRGTFFDGIVLGLLLVSALLLIAGFTALRRRRRNRGAP